MSSSDSIVSTSSERFTGRVKWFNNKAGYGFITVTDGSKSGTDVFVHHSSIKVDSEQYKYLVQGEYIEFTLSDTKTTDHEFQAGEVSGIKGGKLMCETRRDSRSARTNYHTSKSEPEDSSEPVKMPRSVAPPQSVTGPKSVRSRGPREEGGEWTYVAKTRNSSDQVSSDPLAPIPRGFSGRGEGRGFSGRGGRGRGLGGGVARYQGRGLGGGEGKYHQ
jgi:CspA family cold shock protein